MDPSSAYAIASGASSLAGGIIANQANKAEAQKQRDWAANMAGSAWQRAVHDMKLAGINPALAYSQGPAATPGGSSARVEDAISPAVSSAQHTRRLAEEIKSMKASQANTYQDSNLKFEQQLTQIAQRQQIAAQTALTGVEMEIAGENLADARNRGAVSRSGFGRAMSYVDRFRSAVFGGSSPFGVLAGAAVGRFAPRGRTRYVDPSSSRLPPIGIRR